VPCLKGGVTIPRPTASALKRYPMKRCKIRIEHSTHPPYRLKLLPATQVSHVLAYLNLTDNYVLLPLSDPAKTFSPEEKLYGLIANDQKLIAKLSPEAAE
jgi:hypothetical protein